MDCSLIVPITQAVKVLTYFNAFQNTNKFYGALSTGGMGRFYWERRAVNLAMRKMMEHTRKQIRNEI